MRTHLSRTCRGLCALGIGLATLLVVGGLVVGGLGCQGGGDIDPTGGGGKGGNGGGGGGTVVNFDAPSIVVGNQEKCGNGVYDDPEQCDTGSSNGQTGSGCTKTCQVVDGFDCPEWGKPCIVSAKCGDGLLTSTRPATTATTSGDGCSADCETIEDGYECRVPGQRCTPKCGDGKMIGGEACDDGNGSGGDGCSSTCQVEPGADCPTWASPAS